MSTSLRVFATHPVTLLGLQLCHAAVITGFTSPNSFWRLATLPFVLWVAWLAVVTSGEGNHGAYVQGIVASAIVMYPLDYLDRVLLQRWAYVAQGPTRTFDPGNDVVKGRSKEDSRPSSQPAGSFLSRLVFGVKTATSRRHLNSPYEVKNCRHFSAKDKSYVPSRSKFVLASLGMFIACYAFIEVNDANAQSDQDSSLFAQDKFPFFSRLGDVKAEEVAVRFIISAVIWATSYCMIQMAWTGVGIVSVSLGITEVEGWRPMFGSVWELYSVRRFWGNFWHQMLRNMLNDPATLITHKLLRLPAKGLVPRYTKIVLSFFISGVVHMLVDLECGLTFAESHSIRFFTTQALGIMVEDGVQEIWRRAVGHRQAEHGHVGTARWKRVVGFLWLWAFMAWTIPSWMYALIGKRTALEDGPVLGPLSITAWLREMN